MVLARALTPANDVVVEVDSSRLDFSDGGPCVLGCPDSEDFYIREIALPGSTTWIDATGYSSVEEAMLSSVAKGQA